MEISAAKARSASMAGGGLEGGRRSPQQRKDINQALFILRGRRGKASAGSARLKFRAGRVEDREERGRSRARLGGDGRKCTMLTSAFGSAHPGRRRTAIVITPPRHTNAPWRGYRPAS